ncbi:MAG: PQQ-binding-like beta-propeller repeat protein [Candidatus Bathyarchaeota archaeon]|nr:PQQ-binding-like beta-propeller repeat protein [Candidatus Bathyarchaeota archaeon]
MKNLNISKTSIATIILSILLVSSMFIVFASAGIGGPDRTTNDLEARVDPITGVAYGNLSQYEWVSAGNGGENQRYSAGPAPNSPNLLWSQYVGRASGYAGSIPTAYNGMVFVYGPEIQAYNATTGDLIFTSPMQGGCPGFGANDDIVKFSDELFGYLSTTGIVWYNMSDGTWLGKTVFSSASGAYGFTDVGHAGSAMYWGCMYDYESQTMITVAINEQDGKPIAVGIDCSDLLNQGAPVKWIYTLETGPEALGFGGGNAYFGGYGEGIFYAIDIDTGELVWTQNKAGNAGYSITYYNGVVYHSASSTQITALDGATGAVLNTFDVPGGRAFFSYGGAAAYGMYFDGSIQIPQGWTSAWNAETLEQLWKQPSEYYIKYLVGVVADGKFITTTCDRSRGSVLPGGASISDGYRLTAFDVFTGQEVWNLATPGSVLEPCIAYGNMYIMNNYYIECYSDTATSPDGTTGWPFFGGSTTSAGTSTGQYPSDITQALWDFKADAPITGSPVVVDGKACFGTFAGTLYCVDVNTVEELWTFSVDARILSTPAIVDGVVYTGADDGNFYALDATTGAVIWTRSAGGINQGPLQTAALQLNPSPIVYDGKVLCASQDGNLYCLNAVTGAPVWITQVSSVRYGVGGTVAIVPEDLLGRTKVLITANSILYSINFEDGDILTEDLIETADRSGNVAPYPLTQHCKPTVVGDLVFTQVGTGSYAEMRLYNATTMDMLTSVLLSKGSGSTPATESPAYIPSLTVEIADQTNIGWGDSNEEQYIINGTTTMNLDVVIAIECQEVAAWALIPQGTDLDDSRTGVWTVNCSAPYYMVRLWSNWVGHQSFGNPVVAINAQTPGFSAIVYEGNSVYGFTAYNCSSGAILSTYTALAQVFTTPALYQSRLYMTDSAGYLHCFATTVPEFTVPTAEIYASSNKGEEMYVDEAMLIEGRLSALQTFDTDLVNPENFRPPLPYATVTLTFINQDSTSSSQTAVTDANGYFNFSVTPTQTGQAQWLVYFDGMQTLNGQYMDGAYTTYTAINVVDQGGDGGQTTSPSDTATPSEPIPMEYIYAIVGIIVALIVVVAVVMLLRGRKK